MDLSTILSVLVSLFVVEVLLSIDNALVNATIAESIDNPAQRKRALRIGILCGAGFRLVALLFVAFIISNPWIQALGGAYLIYLALEHLGTQVDEKGHIVKSGLTFGKAIVQIAAADLVFSIDNVITAVSFSEHIGLVIAGVLIGVVSMLFITPILANTIRKFPGLSSAAYVIVGLIGIFLLLETYQVMHIGEVYKFLSIAIIIGTTLLFETHLPTRKVLTPLFKKLKLVAGIPFDLVIHPTTREVKAIYSRLIK